MSKTLLVEFDIDMIARTETSFFEKHPSNKPDRHFFYSTVSGAVAQSTLSHTLLPTIPFIRQFIIHLIFSTTLQCRCSLLT